MGPVSRNANCPCGSGRKYKHCCLVREEAAAREARFELAVSRRIQDWAGEQFHDEIEAALEGFVGARRRMENDDITIFTEWFHNDRDLAVGGTPSERYAARLDLPPDERAAASRIAAARLGLHRVLTVEPGISLTLEDVVRGSRVAVRSSHVSREAVRWDILLGRVMTGEQPTLWGPTRSFAPCEEEELLAELDRLARLDGEIVDGRSRLRAFRTHALELMRFRPASWTAEPTFFTIEGDPVAFCSAVWQVHDLDTVTEMLRTFGDLDPDEPVEIDITVSRDSLLAQCPVLPPGAVVLDASPIDRPAASPVAAITLDGDKLLAETISEQRLAHAIDVITDDFGPLVELLEQVATGVNDALATRPSTPRPEKEDEESAWERRLLDEALTTRMRRWPDEPNPALRGRTPREAAAGRNRDEVVRLVRQLENTAERSRRDGRPAFEAGWIRGELGLDDLLAA